MSGNSWLNNPLHEGAFQTNPLHEEAPIERDEKEALSTGRASEDNRTSTIGRSSIAQTKTEVLDPKKTFLGKLGDFGKKVAYFVKTHPPFGTFKVEKNSSKALKEAEDTLKKDIKSFQDLPEDKKIGQELFLDAPRTPIKIGTFQMNPKEFKAPENTETDRNDLIRMRVIDEINKFVDNDENAAINLQNLLSQQTTAYVSEQLLYKFNPDAQSQGFFTKSVSGGNKTYEIQSKGDDIHLRITMRYIVSHKETPEQYGAVRIDIFLPKAELKQKISQETTFKNLRVTNTFTDNLPPSGKYSEEEEMHMMADHFTKKLDSLSKLQT